MSRESTRVREADRVLEADRVCEADSRWSWVCDKVGRRCRGRMKGEEGWECRGERAV